MRGETGWIEEQVNRVKAIHVYVVIMIHSRAGSNDVRPSSCLPTANKAKSRQPADHDHDDDAYYSRASRISSIDIHYSQQKGKHRL